MRSSRKFLLAVSCMGIAFGAHGQMRHYSKDEVPSIEELRMMLSDQAQPPMPPAVRPRVRSKAWVQDGHEDDAQEARMQEIRAPQAMLQAPQQPPSQAREQPLAVAPSAKPRAQGISVEIVFKLNSDELDGRYGASLTNIAQVLTESARAILIEGHTDASGSSELNASLSLRRANAVKAFLVGKGVPSSLVSTRGVGASKLLDRDNPYAGINRRVVFLAL